MRFQFLAVLAVILTVLAGTAAGGEKLLYSFTNGADGGIPIDSGHLILDKSGNLYGTTELGGACGNGTVFKLTHSGSQWTESVLHSFCSDEGMWPNAGLVSDKAGNFYGTTTTGGPGGQGTVFELTPSGGDWTLNTLYGFSGGADGGGPYAGVILDAAGNLYGTTVSGGVSDCRGDPCGAVFELSNLGSGWAETVLYAFTGDDGAYPYAGLVMDKKGNLYGMAQSGGTNGLGVAFKLTKSGGNWTEEVIHSFGTGTDGQFPGYAGLTLHDGVLYGTVPYGGDNGLGVVFKLTKSSSGWNEKVLYSFRGGMAGSSPYTEVKVDKYGNIWGTTVHGGGTTCEAPNGCGTVFVLVHSKANWKEKVLYRFTGSNGANPLANVVFGANGVLYGATSQGGANDTGIVFELKP